MKRVALSDSAKGKVTTKKVFVAAIIIAILTIGGFAGLYVSRSKTSLLRECPDEWIEDRMPTTEDNDFAREYYVFDGERREIDRYDTTWIQNNCSIQIQYVY